MIHLSESNKVTRRCYKWGVRFILQVLCYRFRKKKGERDFILAVFVINKLHEWFQTPNRHGTNDLPLQLNMITPFFKQESQVDADSRYNYIFK
jgi:hypothetical protein